MLGLYFGAVASEAKWSKFRIPSAVPPTETVTSFVTTLGASEAKCCLATSGISLTFQSPKQSCFLREVPRQALSVSLDVPLIGDVVPLNMLFVLWPLISMARCSEIPARIMLRTAVRRKS